MSWGTLCYIYAAFAIATGLMATWHFHKIFRFGSYRVVRAVAFTIIVAMFWWILGPVLFGLGKGKYEL